MASYVQRACESLPGFRQIYEKFCKALTISQHSAGTILAYSSKLAAICLHFHKLPESLTSDDCRDYFHFLLSATPHPQISYFKHTVYSLRAYRKLVGLPCLSIVLPRIRKPKKLPVVLSQEEVCRLLSVCDNLRCKTLLAMIYSCGLRIQELINLKFCHIDMDRMQVFIEQSKGNKDRYVPLSILMPIVLKKYLCIYSPQVYLFNGALGQPIRADEVRFIFRDALRMAHISKPCILYTLRHSYATHLLEMGQNLLRIRDQLGHVDIKTTMCYLHLTRLSDSGAFSPLDRLFNEKNIKEK